MTRANLFAKNFYNEIKDLEAASNLDSG